MEIDYFPLLCIGFLFLLFFYKLLIEKPSTRQKRRTYKYDNSQPKTDTSRTTRKSEEEEYEYDESEEEFDKDERLFGKFMCSKCKKLWQSAHAYINTTQACKKCNVCVYPYELQKLERVEDNENKIDKEKHHIQELCGKCAELGYNCSLKRFTRNDYEYSKPRQGYGFVRPNQLTVNIMK